MINELFLNPLHVINIGLSSFADSIRDAGGKVTHLDWRPPAGGNHDTGLNLATIINHPLVENANKVAFTRFLNAQPVLCGVGIARNVIPDLGDRTLLHAGPPIKWSQMCGPMKGAIVGAILFEGWAKTHQEAETYAASGKVKYAPCHHYSAVGPMAGIISPSMPVWIVENKDNGQKAFSNLNEGLGKVLRFGANDSTVLDRLKWMAEVLAPALDSALRYLGGIELRPIIAQALHMGDECHNRNSAASALLLKKIAPALLRVDTPKEDTAAIFDFITSNDHFFLNISMAACKATLDAAHNVKGSSLITAMARNGVEFGVRMSGTGDTWFTAPAPMVDGLFFPGYTKADAAPDMGDSAITETAGIGGFAMGGAPAIVQFVGGTPKDAIAYTLEMFHITQGINGGYTSPALNFSGLPAGIDARKVVDSGIQPVINTGIAHREAGIGQIGAGVTRAPMECFIEAVNALAQIVAKLE